MGWLRAQFRESKALRAYILPAASPLFALAIPLVYELHLFEPRARLTVYFAGAVVSAVLAVIYINLDKGYVKELQKAATEADQEKQRLGLALREQVRIFSHIKDIVHHKSSRFVQVCKKIKAGEVLSRAEIFSTITQPDLQIAYIIEQISRFFTHGREGRSVNVVLFAPDYAARHFGYPFYYPTDQRPSIPEGQFGLDSGVPGAALRRNDIVVVADVKEDLAKDAPTYFVTNNSSVPRNGSVLCMPLRDSERDEVPYVLSIFINEPGVFEDKDYLREVIEPFAQRILLEDRLRLLRQKAGQ